MENHEFPRSLAIILAAAILGVLFVVGVTVGLIIYAGFFAPAAP